MMSRLYFIAMLVIVIVMVPEFNCFASGIAPLKTVARNVIHQLNVNADDELVVVNSESKARLAESIIAEAKDRNVLYKHFRLQLNSDSLTLLESLIGEDADNRYFVFLIDIHDAGFLFEYAGRPDLGLKIDESHLFSDWLMPGDQFVRLNSIDLEENFRYQDKVRSLLNTTDTVHIVTDIGTDLRFIARNWITGTGEIFCTPVEHLTYGTVIVDACAYFGPPAKPVRLNVINGKVTNIKDLSATDRQENQIAKDLSLDDNSSFLSEVGIGTNKNAHWNSDLMESEQSRITCHFGFGMNLNYGGEIESSTHFDLVILKPTITVGNKVVCEKGSWTK